MENSRNQAEDNLRVIAEMINLTKRNKDIDLGNLFLLWGYLCVLVPLAVYAMLLVTGNEKWKLLYYAIAAVGCLVTFINRIGREKAVTTHISHIIEDILYVTGMTSVLIVIVCSETGFQYYLVITQLIFSIGVRIVGGVLKDSRMKFISVVVICISGIEFGYFDFFKGLYTNMDILVFACSFALMMVLPGHRLKRQAYRDVQLK